MKAAMTGSLAAELGAGQVEIAFAQLAVMGAVYGIKKLMSHHQEKKQRKEDSQNAQVAEQQRQIEEQRAEAQRQAEAQAEADRQRAEALERQRQEEIKHQQEVQAQHELDLNIQQESLNNQRIAQNDEDVQRARAVVDRSLAIESSNRNERIQQRMRGMDVNVESSYYSRRGFPINVIFPPALLQSDRPEDEVWRLIDGTYIPGYVEPQRQGLNPPDGGPDGDGNGGGGPNMPSGGGGNNPPDGAGANQNNQGYRYPWQNPDYQPLMKIAEAIANQINKEKESVEDVHKEDEQKQQEEAATIPADPNQREPLGKNPATWSPDPSNPYNPGLPSQSDEMPGKNGSGTLQPVNPITKEKMGQAGLDNAHIVQKELEVVIANQGYLEQSAEDQIALMAKIAQLVPTLKQQQVMMYDTDVYSSQVRRF